MVQGTARSEGTGDQGQASGGERPALRGAEGSGRCGGQPTPAPGPPLTARTGSAPSCPSKSDVHSASQSRSAGAGAANQSAVASVPSRAHSQ